MKAGSEVSAGWRSLRIGNITAVEEGFVSIAMAIDDSRNGRASGERKCRCRSDRRS
jgi:hypothetical protein